MKFYSGTALFKFSWDQVAVGFWCRYPNPCSNHVLSEDVLERKIVRGKLLTKRIICKTNSIPKWGERFVHGCRHVYVLEESIVDPSRKRITTYTRNIGLQKYMALEEKCTYNVSETNSQWVGCERLAWINSSIRGFSSLITSFGLKRFQKNAHNAVDGFTYVLKTMYAPELLSVADEAESSTKNKAEKLRESAKKAKEIAKSQAEKARAKVHRPVVYAHKSDAEV